jgi:hypothetical protein
MELSGGDSVAKASIELLYIRARSDLLEEILSDYVCFKQTGQALFVGIVFEDRAMVVELDHSMGKRVQFLLVHGIDFFENRDFGWSIGLCQGVLPVSGF